MQFRPKFAALLNLSAATLNIQGEAKPRGADASAFEQRGMPAKLEIGRKAQGALGAPANQDARPIGPPSCASGDEAGPARYIPHAGDGQHLGGQRRDDTVR